MTQQRFDEINNQLESGELKITELSEQEIREYYEFANSSNGSSVSIPNEAYILAGASLGVAVGEQLGNVSIEAMKSGSIRTVGKVSVFVEMAVNIYNMTKGTFKFNLENTLNLVSTTLICLSVLGVNVACLGAIATVMASNPFTVGLGIISIVVSYYAVDDVLSKLKTAYMSCYNTYRRLFKLSKWIDTNKIIYDNLNKVLDYEQQQIEKIQDEFLNSLDYNLQMKRKTFIPAHFNSFILFNNIITFIQANQEISTAKDGMYNDFIDFCSVEDYIDTFEVMQKDIARIEYFVLQNDLRGLKDFVISIDFLNGYFDTYLLNPTLTEQTKKDIKFVQKCVKDLKTLVDEKNLINLKEDNEEFKNPRNPKELFDSIYSYLIYSSAMQNSPFVVCKTLLNQKYYSTQNIYEYVNGFSEYAVYLFANWYFYFGNIMFNDIYIDRYKTELIKTYNASPMLYDKEFVSECIKNIDVFDDYKVKFVWLYSIKEFFENIINYKFWQYSPYFATSFTQTGIDDKTGKTLYNYYLPDNEYIVPELKTLINNFVKYLNQNGYRKDKFSYLTDEFDTLKLDKKIFKLKFINETFKNTPIFSVNNFSKDLFDVNDSGVKLSPLNEFFGSAITNNTSVVCIDNVIKEFEFDIDDIDYYGSASNITDFYARILIKHKSMSYLYSFMFLACDKKNEGYETYSYINFCYMLSKYEHLRQLFFNGYQFKTTKIYKEFYQSVKDFIDGKRNDIIVYWYKDISYIDMFTLSENMIDISERYKELKEIYNNFKNEYESYRTQVQNDIVKIGWIISSANDIYNDIKKNYPQYASIFKNSYADKYNQYLYNLYTEAVELANNDYNYITNIKSHLVPVYKLENGYIQLETYYPPMFILLQSKDDTDLSQAYYLYNKQALNHLFNIADETFNEKVKNYQDLVSLTIQPEIVNIDHKQIIDNIADNIQKMYDTNKEEMVELIGSQESEYILMQNLININQTQEFESNVKLALETEQQIKQDKRTLDKNNIIKYAIGVGLFLILAGRGRK